VSTLLITQASWTMRKRTITSSASALLLLLASLVSGKHATHEHLNALHKRHRASREISARSTSEDGDMGVEIRAISETTPVNVEKRGGQCAFPYDAGLVPVTPGQMNAGWAMSPDQPPKPGSYMPYACPPGQVSVQWDPSATSYSYPKSMVCLYSTIGKISTNRNRMADCTVTTTAMSRSHSQINHTAKQRPTTSALPIKLGVLFLSVRLCFQAMKPC